MTKLQLEQLIKKYLDGTATKREALLVERFYAKLIEDKSITTDWNEDDKNKIKERMYQKTRKKIRANGVYLTHFLISAAAAVLILLVIGHLYFNNNSGTIPEITSSTESITAIAGQSQRSVLLSDGSYILLQPGATLIYPQKFSQHKRFVKLSGEAWFDIQSDSLRPFQVVANDVTTTVLGTSFSINANPKNAKVEVKVTSGIVKVSSSDGELAVLQKNDQLDYYDGDFKVTRIGQTTKEIQDLPVPGMWRLANVTMTEALEFIEKRWDIKYRFENPAIENCPLYASFNANDSLEEVLMIICGVSQSEFRLDDDTIAIYGQGCTQ